MPTEEQRQNGLIKVEGNYWGDVRQENTNKVERQCVHDGYKTGHDVRSRMLVSLNEVGEEMVHN